MAENAMLALDRWIVEQLERAGLDEFTLRRDHPGNPDSPRGMVRYAVEEVRFATGAYLAQLISLSVNTTAELERAGRGEPPAGSLTACATEADDWAKVSQTARRRLEACIDMLSRQVAEPAPGGS